MAVPKNSLIDPKNDALSANLSWNFFLNTNHTEGFLFIYLKYIPVKTQLYFS